MTAPDNGAIACLGWGSLVWDPRDLPCGGNWQSDGPLLPLEFARESGAKNGERGDRITLVICPGHVRVRALWVLLDVVDLNEARQRLAVREGIPDKNLASGVGFVDCTSGEMNGLEADTISAWASAIGLRGVVWTNLRCKFNGRTDMPTEMEVLAFLRDLKADKRAIAEGYVRQAPRQIDTAYRRAIEREIGWTCRS